jgi:hypothetical protein
MVRNLFYEEYQQMMKGGGDATEDIAGASMLDGYTVIGASQDSQTLNKRPQTGTILSRKARKSQGVDESGKIEN